MDPNDPRDYYADLGLQLGASHTSIKAAFHTLAKQHHPDKSGINDTSEFRRAREAYEKLTDASYRAKYDKSYWNTKLHTDGHTDVDGDGDEGLGYTRTAQYEQEQESSRPPSPPPMKPFRKPGEPGWLYFTSKTYQEWQKKDAEHHARHPERDEEKHETTNPGHTAHGLTVQMTSHPAAKQRCTNRAQHWRGQVAGIDYCVFCMAQTRGGSRCPGCEALACQKCLQEVVALERKASGGLGAKAQYRSSGG
ncbi:DnaJ-domain-containing protein [Cucurbitaria berberidis CBS 394.84]|uniref:DnaJ-domain-containing protein n=1 Tax=Cucurbitaria berberidis CBS 394.84 TaxID=1168544 RepID=A0A9P4L7E2_9PLEO|nr:DnaJ-domain-containing protein [Cucurbitaria berberidis CBS 394.84]KAF1844013.1 DnaJ-domain-containing protein [Cucurbitaria berberidis CBS 394.84]